jgi:hypothetical protein
MARPAISQEGLISVVQNPQRAGPHKTVFTAVGFNARADCKP